jgi:hypothetical protein
MQRTQWNQSIFTKKENKAVKFENITKQMFSNEIIHKN